VVPVALGTLDGISAIRIYLPKDLRPPEARLSVLKSIEVRGVLSGGQARQGPPSRGLTGCRGAAGGQASASAGGAPARSGRRHAH
jgi:hypothetical protein